MVGKKVFHGFSKFVVKFHSCIFKLKLLVLSLCQYQIGTTWSCAIGPWSRQIQSDNGTIYRDWAGSKGTGPSVAGARGLQRGTLRASLLHGKGQSLELGAARRAAAMLPRQRTRGAALQFRARPGERSTVRAMARPPPRAAPAHTHGPVLIQLAQPATPEKSNSISALCSSTIPPSRCSQSWGTGASFKDTCMPPTRRCICRLSLRVCTPSWLLTREEGKLGWVLLHFLNQTAKLVLVC